MDVAQYTALLIFASYFALILVLFYIILTRSIRWRSMDLRGWIFLGLTGASFLHTWYYMFQFMFWSFENYEASLGSSPEGPLSLTQIANWLVDTALFEQAWAAACAGPFNWWWSEQLCLFTAGAWTVFIISEGRRRSVKHLWAYMLLGQLVAISVAMNLLYVALLASEAPGKEKSTRRLSPAVWLSVLGSMVAIGLSPYTSEQTFLPNLLVMHALLVLPLFAAPSADAGPYSLGPRALYSLSTVLSLALRIRTGVAAYTSLPEGTRNPPLFRQVAWTTLHSHPAQSSIGWDVVWTSVSFLAWQLIVEDRASALADKMVLVMQTALFSVGVMAPTVLRRRARDGVKRD